VSAILGGMAEYMTDAPLIRQGDVIWDAFA